MKLEALFVFLALLSFGLSACQNSSPTNASGPQATPTPTLSPVSTPDIVISRSVVGVTATPNYGGSVTYSVSVCNDGVSFGAPTSIMDVISDTDVIPGSDFQFVCWGWNGIIPYSNSTQFDQTHPFASWYGSTGVFTFQSVPSGCTTLLAVYQNSNWAQDNCQTFIHETWASLSIGTSIISEPETITAPCPSATLSPTPTLTSTVTDTPLYSYTPTPTPSETSTFTETDTFTSTGTPTDTPTATDTFTPCPNATQVGDTAPGASAVTLVVVNTYAQKYDVLQPATLKRIWIQPTQYAMFRFGLYSNSPGGDWPQDLLYSSSVTLSAGLGEVDLPDIPLASGTYWLAIAPNGYSTGFQAASGSTVLQAHHNLSLPCRWTNCSSYSCSLAPTPTPNTSCPSPTPGVATGQILLYGEVCP